MKIETIRRLCIAKGMMHYDLFVKFFSKRFPDESDEVESYCNEWIDRFMSGNPTSSMDSRSLKIYVSLINACQHNDGWVMKDELVINPAHLGNEFFKIECECNHLGCDAKKKFSFEITNIKEDD